MKTEKTKLYKFYYFNRFSNRYIGVCGLYHSFDDLFDFLKSRYGEYHATRFLKLLNFIKIPFFGYHSPQFTALDPRGLAVNEKPEV